MTDRAQLLALADRAEAATGADRGLDAAVYDQTEHALDYQRIGIRLQIEKRPDRYHDGWVTVYGAKGENDPYPEDLPRYSASLDAALNLVPNGCGWRIWAPADDSLQKHRATIWAARGRPLFAPFDVEAATPALALTSAILRARAEMQP